MKSNQLYRILTQDGWFSVSQSGSHVKMRHKTKTWCNYLSHARK
ncbi:MAG: type II toxin-antitoxin system HicA family toxin [Cyclobacteriaceae bacterium]|nr:type II toxin-antitoxin system HicA family toxin [Cyclobacteriaceae bacterium]